MTSKPIRAGGKLLRVARRTRSACDGNCNCGQRGFEKGIVAGWFDAYHFLNPTATDADADAALDAFLDSFGDDDDDA